MISFEYKSEINANPNRCKKGIYTTPPVDQNAGSLSQIHHYKIEKGIASMAVIK
jgi:hypothetical protein